MRKEINALNKEIEQLRITNLIKDRILSVIGHDLRDIALSYNNISKKIKFLIDKDRMQDVILLGKHIDGQGSKFVQIIDKILFWADRRKNLPVTKDNALSLDDEIIEKLNQLTAHVDSFESDNKGIELMARAIEQDSQAIDEIARSLLTQNTDQGQGYEKIEVPPKYIKINVELEFSQDGAISGYRFL